MNASSEARITAQAIERVRALIDAPLRVVPMTAKEWAAVEKRSRKTMGSKEGARRSFQAAAGRRYRPREGSWREVGL